MTLIIGIKGKNGVMFGADSFGSNGFVGETYENKKVFPSKDTKKIIFGVSGSYRDMDQLAYTKFLEESLAKLIDHNLEEVTTELLVTKFIPKLITAFQDKTVGDSKVRKPYFMMAHGNKMWQVQGDYSVMEVAYGYHSIGSGTYHADATAFINYDKPVEERLLDALLAAEKSVVSVRRPFYMISTKDGKRKELKIPEGR